MEGNITNHYPLKLVDLKLAEKTKIWREKSLCSKHDETLGSLIPFEVTFVIKIYSTYWLLFKFWVSSLSKMKNLSSNFLFQQILDDLFIKYEGKFWLEKWNQQLAKQRSIKQYFHHNWSINLSEGNEYPSSSCSFF